MLSMYDKSGNEKNILENEDIERGTNYIKLSNGIAIVFMKKDFQGSFVPMAGEYRLTLASPFYFPFTFKEVPTICVSTASTVDYAFCSAVGVLRDNAKIIQIALGRPTEINNTIVGVQVIAVGRWK